jgi:RNA polymerase subunit RPABC4/transcription elongation factor Spt4
MRSENGLHTSGDSSRSRAEVTRSGLAACDECGQLIPLAEMRCRYCGTEYYDNGEEPLGLGWSVIAFAGIFGSLWVFGLWLLLAVPCALIGGVIGPRKGVDTQFAMLGCGVTTIVGLAFLVALPEVTGWQDSRDTWTLGTESQQPQLWPCPRCATPIWSTSVFCPQCGIQLAPPPYQPPAGS